jgi:hypothetical protein
VSVHEKWTQKIIFGLAMLKFWDVDGIDPVQDRAKRGAFAYTKMNSHFPHMERISLQSERIFLPAPQK